MLQHPSSRANLLSLTLFPLVSCSGSDGDGGGGGGSSSSSKIKQSLYRPIGFQDVETPRCLDIWHMKVVGLSAPHTSCVFPPGNIPVRGLSQPQSHSAARRIMLIKKIQ